jgi:hypothetical protein
MSDIERKRSFVYDLYPGKHWHDRVKRMSDAQILAIYLRNQNQPHHDSEEKPDDDNPIPF